ncbi:MAG: EAL domain-containing protein [Ruminococcus sp.]|nr:EAL domain-containing protein [Ruminococcus sp.]
MGFFETNGLASYSNVGDVVVMAMVMLMGILLMQSYFRKNTGIKIMLCILAEVFTAALVKIVYRAVISRPHPNIQLAYCLREIHYIMLTFVLMMYALYIFEPLWIPRKKQRKYMRAMFCLAAVTVIAEILGIVFKFGFYFREDGTTHRGITTYLFSYFVIIGSILVMIIKYHHRLIRQVFVSLIGLNLISIMMIVLQWKHGSSSYTTFAYFVPIIGMIYMFHSNPFDVETGAVDERFFADELEECLNSHSKMTMLLCSIRDFDKLLRSSKELKYEFYQFFRSNVKRGVLYNFPNGKMLLALRAGKKSDHSGSVEKMLADFRKSYSRFRHDYKIIILETSDKISDPQDYVNLLDYIETRMDFNQEHFVSEDDIKKFYNSRYILSQLEDIAQKKDLSDERVLVYCQPVYNISKGRYDTAEALMRLKLDQTGMVFPDQFIPLAEKYNLIHSLSLVILNKTCAAIRDFIEEGYELRRISVNFSEIDIRYSEFCSEVQRIIDRNGIPYDKIAVEITGSRSDADFNIMKEKVLELQKLGIKFYLDDFGTGYSNFERIMEIPFDIIKFDRSMLIESNKSESSKYMVNTFADMFNSLKYAVLFEGVENSDDEQNCMNMKAKYLQGYKYSKPIPIEQLRDFLSKAEEPGAGAG